MNVPFSKLTNPNSIFAETKEATTKRMEKKPIVALPVASSSVATISSRLVKHSTNSTNNISEKEQRKEIKEREREIREREKEKERESTEKAITSKESKRDPPKESKRDESEIARKRDRATTMIVMMIHVPYHHNTIHILHHIIHRIRMTNSNIEQS